MRPVVKASPMLAEESPVLEIDARILSPQRWALTLTWPDGATREVEVAGDAWRVEAVVLKHLVVGATGRDLGDANLHGTRGFRQSELRYLASEHSL